MKALLKYVALLAFSAIASATTFTGTFLQDDDVVLIPINVAIPTLVTIQTTSFAAGGFEPVLTLYDAGGNLFLQDAIGGSAPANCGIRGIDPVSTFCLDKVIQAMLSGNYTIALTEFDNIPGGPTLADGFPKTGSGNFTGVEFGLGSGSFLLFDGSQRSSSWTIVMDDAAVGAVPEPGTAMLMFVLIPVWVAARTRKK